MKPSGRELDPETGLYYYRARYYDPDIGRFIQEDPIGFNAGVNFYTYVGNKPIAYNDPFGLQEMFPLDPRIPFPYLPLPDSHGCFGTLAFFSFGWNSSEPDKTTFSMGGASLGGGGTICYDIQCDSCPPGGDAGNPNFGLSTLFKKPGIGVGVSISKDQLCFSFGFFGSFLPFGVSMPIGAF